MDGVIEVVVEVVVEGANTPHLWTLVIAIAGLLISLGLFIWTIIRDVILAKRQLSIFVEIFRTSDMVIPSWDPPDPSSVETSSIRITNSGYRPVTVVAISAFVDGGRITGSNAPRSELDREDKLPVNLKDGENVELILEGRSASYLRKAICSQNRHADISVWDAEGNKYTKYGVIVTNEKWGFARVYKSVDHYPYKTAGWRKRRIINFFPRVFEKPILFFYKTKYNLKKKFKRNK